MSLLRLEGVRREFGTFVLLDSVSASLARGERVGLVGPNGAGKTTLLEIAAGREEPDAGRAVRASGTSIALLSQEANLDASFAGAPDVRAAVRAGAAEVERLERRLATLEAGGSAGVGSPEYATGRERFEALDGYHLDQRVEETLSGLGIGREDWDRSPLALSGGQQTRVALARLLVADPDLLMLDEPTNHLDVAAIEWLEATLGRRDRALLVASHDRAFLDAVVTRIWELRDRRLHAFRGGYSAYLVQREAADARQRRDADEHRTAMAREEELVGRYRSQRKHVKMHEHERRLEQLRASAVDDPSRQRRLALSDRGMRGGRPARSSEVAVSLQDLVCGFPGGGAGDVPIARADRLEARSGDRIGLVGPNGAGKTTLLRTLAGELPALSGFVRMGNNVQPAYLAQLRDRPLPGETVLEALVAGTRLDPGPARAWLARFLFRGEDVFKPVSELSGGERSRLELALLGIGEANLLLLDEPTNHLDIPAREALETFLRETPATLLVVSHDRRLLESVCGRLWVVEAGPAAEPARVAPFEGGYREWRAAVGEGWSVAGELARQAGARPAAGHGATRPAGGDGASQPSARRATTTTQQQQPASQRQPPQRQAPLSKDAYRRQQQRIEEDLTRLGVRKSQLELALGDPSVRSNFVELRRLTSELADVDAALAQAEDAWLSLADRAPR
jgi:ATP-binding cassette, subfamily F, member 3